jgi:hypothetical protein
MPLQHQQPKTIFECQTLNPFPKFLSPKSGREKQEEKNSQDGKHDAGTERTSAKEFVKI